MKNLQTTVQTKDLGDGAIEAVVADESLDRDGEKLLMKGLDVSKFKKNPVVQWAHDYSRPPVGKAESITKKADGSLVAKIKFAITESDFAKEVYALYKGGFLSAFSIGFLPIEAEDNVYTKSEMLEFSAVPVPANANALVTAKAKGVISDETYEQIGKQTQKQTQTQTIEVEVNTQEIELAADLLAKAAEKLGKEVKAYKTLDRAGASPRKKRVRLVRVKQAAQLAQSVSQSTCNLSELRTLKRRSIRRVHVKTK